MDVDSLVERLRAGRRAAAAAREAASAEPAAPRLEPTATAAGTDAATTDVRQQSRALFQRYFDNDDDARTPPSPPPPTRTAAAGWPVPEERPRPPPAPAAPAGKAEAVQGTNVDAQISKLSAVQLGYMEDRYLHHFVKTPTRRPPIINRGYFARHYLIERLVQAFLDMTDGPVQLLTLGAGFDTRPFRYKDQPRLTVFEVDFPAVAAAKAAVITATPELREALGLAMPPAAPADAVHTDRYHLVGGDLVDLPKIEVALVAKGLIKELPTLVISECVLIYLKTPDADAVVHWVGTFFEHAMILCYEQIQPNDPFGQMMLQNLQARGMVLHSIHAYPTVEAQVARFKRAGFDHSTAVDMLTAYRRHIPPQERLRCWGNRIARLELFDEVEEWNLIMQHYSLAWASRGLPRPAELPVYAETQADHPFKYIN